MNALDLLTPHEREEVVRTVRILREGGVVYMPTDSIWGISARISAYSAIERVYAIKGREEGKPFICGVSSPDMLAAYVPESVLGILRNIALRDVRPTTVVIDSPRNIPPWVIAPDGTLALRIIRHTFASAVIDLLREPVITTSLNRSGEPPARNPQEAPPDLLAPLDHVVRWDIFPFHYGKPSRILRIDSEGNTEVIRE